MVPVVHRPIRKHRDSVGVVDAGEHRIAYCDCSASPQVDSVDKVTCQVQAFARVSAVYRPCADVHGGVN